VNDELVRPTEKDFGWQIPAQFAAEGARDGGGLERKLLPTGGHIAAAFLALHYERFSA